MKASVIAGLLVAAVGWKSASTQGSTAARPAHPGPLALVVPVRFRIPDVYEYLELIEDTAGPLAFAVRELSDPGRARVRADVEDAFGRFETGDGYELPGIVLCAVGS